MENSVSYVWSPRLSVIYSMNDYLVTDLILVQKHKFLGEKNTIRSDNKYLLIRFLLYTCSIFYMDIIYYTT